MNLHEKRKARQIGLQCLRGWNGPWVHLDGKPLNLSQWHKKVPSHSLLQVQQQLPGQWFRDPVISSHASLFQVTEGERERETLDHHSLVLQGFSPEWAWGTSPWGPLARTSHMASDKLQGRLGNGGHRGTEHEVPLLEAHWPELVTWPQTNYKGGWEMGATGVRRKCLRRKCLCHSHLLIPGPRRLMEWEEF